MLEQKEISKSSVHSKGNMAPCLGTKAGAAHDSALAAECTCGLGTRLSSL